MWFYEWIVRFTLTGIHFDSAELQHDHRPSVEIYLYRETLKFIYSDTEIQWMEEAKRLYLYVAEGYGNINGSVT